MEPVPYEIREEDVDEVLSAWESTGGRTFDDETRDRARAHVMKQVTDIDDVVRTTPETSVRNSTEDAPRAFSASAGPGETTPARRETALAAIEDILIRDGFIDAAAGEQRVFPVTD